MQVTSVIITGLYTEERSAVDVLKMLPGASPLQAILEGIAKALIFSFMLVWLFLSAVVMYVWEFSHSADILKYKSKERLQKGCSEPGVGISNNFTALRRSISLVEGDEQKVYTSSHILHVCNNDLFIDSCIHILS